MKQLLNKINNNKYLLITTFIIIFICKFYHYNYIENTHGQARILRLDGLNELVCNGLEKNTNGIDKCGSRSIYGDADWGITAYFTIYGIESYDEAKKIATFMYEARKKNKQENIPMNVEIYSVARSAGSSRPSKYKIYEQDF